MIISEQSAELIEHNNDDLLAVNAARVSFGKWASEFNINPNTGKKYTRINKETGKEYEVDGDTSLINYLVKHNHFTPLAHPRICLKSKLSNEPIITNPSDHPETTINPLKKDLTLRAGLVSCGGDSVVKNSIIGWIKLIQMNWINPKMRIDVINALIDKCPSIMSAYGFTAKIPLENYTVETFELGSVYNPGMVDITFRVKAPIFVARQLVKHQIGLVWNEVSRRYVDFEPEFYIPDMLRAKADNKKQGSTNEPIEYNKLSLEGLKQTCSDSLKMYEELLSNNVCAEQARMVLPQNMMTEWIWTGSLSAWFRVINLRLDPHSQKETIDVVQLIANQIKEKYPQAYERYVSV